MRHAEAESWNPLGNDFTRALSPAGNRHAQLVSAWAFEALAPPDTLLCSPARRTRETLAPFLSLWPRLLAATDYVESIYNASLDLLLNLVGDAFSYSERLMLVGHNPGVMSLLCSVLPTEQAAGIGSMDAGTLAVVGFPAGFNGRARSGKLLHVKRRQDFSFD
jgi:phosphohistidine phosphatase